MSAPVVARAALGRTPVVQREGRECCAFVGACAGWAAARRRDLRPGVVWLAALLCGDDWLAARPRGRKAWRRLVERDVEEASRACQVLGDEDADPEVTSAAVALCLRATVQERYRVRRPLWSTPRPRIRRRVGRAIRRIDRKVTPWAGPDAGHIRSMRGFRAGLAKAVDACSLLTVQEWTRAATHPWPVSVVQSRPVDHVACLLLHLAVFLHHYNERSRRYAAGSYGNDIIDRARAWVGGGEDFEEVRSLFRHFVARKDGAT